MSASRLVKHVSAKQRRANRANAQRSTGPRSAEGKRVVARNALTHGIFFKDLLMPGESQAELDEFAIPLLADLKPQDHVEMSLCEQYVEARWRIRRVRRAEHKAHARFVEGRVAMGQPIFRDRVQEKAQRVLDSLDPYKIALPLPKLNPDPVEPASLTVADSLCDCSDYPDGGPYGRLARYQHQLELSADRALRQLHKLRKERGVDASKLEDSPFLENQDEGAAGAQDHDESDSEGGVVTSVTTSSIAHKNTQNKPISKPTPASRDASTTCDAPSRHTSGSATPEIFHPVHVGARGASRDMVAEATSPLEEQ